MNSDFASTHVTKQLIRSSSSAGANYEEARAGESRNDFIHKVGIALKEVREAVYWLKLIQRASLAKVEAAGLIREGIELAAILGKSMRTARANSE